MKTRYVILGGFLFYLLWNLIYQFLLSHFLTVNSSGDMVETPLGAFCLSVIWAPLWEEVAFRYGPLEIAKRLKKKANFDIILPIIMISSVIFGWGHGYGPLSVLNQGVAGLALSFVYLKGGFRASVALHMMWNLFCFIMADGASGSHWKLSNFF